ncbi:MAG: TRAP transporter small permease subunit [Pseudomonadota bacterium]
MTESLPDAASATPARSGNIFIDTTRFVSTFCGWVAAGMILLAVAITCQMIFVRFVLNGSTVWQTEMVIYLMIAATLLGLPFVQYMRGHVNVDLVPLALPIRARKVMALFTLSISLLICGVMAVYGFDYWYHAFSRGWTSDTVWAVRLWIPYASLPLGFGLLFLQMFADLVAVIFMHDRPFGLEAD